MEARPPPALVFATPHHRILCSGSPALRSGAAPCGVRSPAAWGTPIVGLACRLLPQATKMFEVVSYDALLYMVTCYTLDVDFFGIKSAME